MRQRWSGCAHRRRLKILRDGSSCSALEIGGDGRYRTSHLTPTQLLLDAQGTQREERLGALAAVPGERPLTVGQLYVAHTQAGLGASHMRCVASLDSMSCWRISSSCERRVSQCFSWASVKRASVAIIASQRVGESKATRQRAGERAPPPCGARRLVCYHPSVTPQELPRPKTTQITDGTNVTASCLKCQTSCRPRPADSAHTRTSRFTEAANNRPTLALTKRPVPLNRGVVAPKSFPLAPPAAPEAPRSLNAPR